MSGSKLTDYGMRRAIFRQLGLRTSNPHDAIAIKHVLDLTPIEAGGLFRFLEAHKEQRAGIGLMLHIECDLTTENGLASYLRFHGLFVRIFEQYGRDRKNRIAIKGPHIDPNDQLVLVGTELIKKIGVMDRPMVAQLNDLNDKGAIALASNNPEKLDQIVALLEKYPDRYMDSGLFETITALRDGWL